MMCRTCHTPIVPGRPGTYIHTPTIGDPPPCDHAEGGVPAMSVGRIVHYVARGSADGRFPLVCRAATVTEADAHSGAGLLGLMVANPSGLFFHPLEMGGVEYDGGDPEPGAVGARCTIGGPLYPGGTWHVPERV